MIKQIGKFNLDKIQQGIKKQKQTLVPNEVAKVAIKDFKDNFKEQGFDGDPWAKRKKAKNYPILNNTGKLKNSIKAIIKTFRKIIITATADYAKYHQSGTGDIPARPFIGQSDDLTIKTEKEIIKILDKTIKINLKKR